MAQEDYSGRFYGYGSAGPWKQTTRGYLGLKFVIQGQVHYGWARLNVTATTASGSGGMSAGIYGAISEYAYETVPNKPILTGQQGGATRKKHNGRLGPASLDAPTSTPGGLGRLANGAPSVPARRGQDITRK